MSLIRVVPKYCVSSSISSVLLSPLKKLTEEQRVNKLRQKKIQKSFCHRCGIFGDNKVIDVT